MALMGKMKFTISRKYTVDVFKQLLYYIHKYVFKLYQNSKYYTHFKISTKYSCFTYQIQMFLHLRFSMEAKKQKSHYITIHSESGI